MDLAQTLDFEKMAVDICWNSKEMEEGFKSFLEKESSSFQGEIDVVRFQFYVPTVFWEMFKSLRYYLLRK